MITRQMHYDSSINFRISSKLKNQFINKCEEQNLHYQKILRQLIQNYVNTSIDELEKQKREQYLKTQRLL